MNYRPHSLGAGCWPLQVSATKVLHRTSTLAGHSFASLWSGEVSIVTRYKTVAAPNSIVACACNESSKGLPTATWNIHMEFGDGFQLTGLQGESTAHIHHCQLRRHLPKIASCHGRPEMLDLLPPLQLHRRTCPEHLTVYCSGVDTTPSIDRFTHVVHGLYR